MIAPDEHPLRREKPKPFISYEGIGGRVAVTHRDGGVIILKTSLSVYLFLILALGAFGPGMTAMMYLQWEQFAAHPVWLRGVVVLFNLLGWLFCGKYLRELLCRRPFIEINKLAQTVSLCRKHLPQPERVIRREEMEGISLFPSLYYRGIEDSRRGNVVPNVTLRLHLKNGENIDLCTSDREDHMRDIARLVGPVVPFMNGKALLLIC